VLTPPPELEADLMAFSAELGRSVRSEIILGPKAIPHVTVV
jgi:hypothetical protein